MLAKKRSFPNGFERLWKNLDDMRMQNWANMQKDSLKDASNVERNGVYNDSKMGKSFCS